MDVDGFLVPVKTARKQDYIAMAARFAAIFRANGALSVVEAWADDVAMGDVTSFPRAVKLEADETVVFSYVTCPNRATRDACVAAVMADPAMQENGSDGMIDGKRMVFGGFEAVVEG